MEALNHSSAISSSVTEVMQRLSAKSTVIASLIIDRKTSSVLASSGQTSVFETSKFSNAPAASQETEDAYSSGIIEFARTVWNHVNLTSQMVRNMDDEVCILDCQLKLNVILTN